MTLNEFVKDLTEEMKENEWQDKEIEFCTVYRDSLSYLSIYAGDDNKVLIDVGTEEDDNENKASLSELGGGMV